MPKSKKRKFKKLVPGSPLDTHDVIRLITEILDKRLAKEALDWIDSGEDTFHIYDAMYGLGVAIGYDLSKYPHPYEGEADRETLEGLIQGLFLEGKARKQ